MTKFQLHVKKWNNCTACEAHRFRRQVVHYRGHIPCDLAFIGEAPGDSEDVLGKPFVGPAGKLLDEMISKSIDNRITIGFFNITGCLPEEQTPSKESVKACSTKLMELLEMAKPKRIIALGKVASDALLANKVVAISCVHPAAILRANHVQRQQAMANCLKLFSKVSSSFFREKP